MLQSILVILILGAGLYLAVSLLIFMFQAHLIYFPSKEMMATPADMAMPYEAVQLKTADGVNLSGWFIPTPGVDTTVLFFHGNAGNISHRLGSIALFQQLGLNVFIMDYRGYGQSEGAPDEQGTYNDADAAWRYLIDERGLAPQDIIIFGRSLGGAVGAWLAEKHQPRGLILESTFSSVPDVAAQHYPLLPVRLLARIRYDTLNRMKNISCPVLVIHSPDDETIPYDNGNRLFQAANEPKSFLALSGKHNEGFVISEDSYKRGLLAFINELD